MTARSARPHKRAHARRLIPSRKRVRCSLYRASRLGLRLRVTSTTWIMTMPQLLNLWVPACPCERRGGTTRLTRFPRIGWDRLRRRPASVRGGAAFAQARRQCTRASASCCRVGFPAQARSAEQRRKRTSQPHPSRHPLRHDRPALGLWFGPVHASAREKHARARPSRGLGCCSVSSKRMQCAACAWAVG